MNKSTMFLIFGTLVGTTSLSYTLAPPIVAEANSDEETQKEEETSFIPLEEGTANDTVLEIEEYLETLDYIAVTPDRIYDEETTEAVEAFQTENSLEITGAVDEETFNTLKQLAEDTLPVEEEPEADSSEEASDDEQNTEEDTEEVTEEDSDTSASTEQSNDTEAEDEATETEEADHSVEKQDTEAPESSDETEPANEAESESEETEENVVTEEPEEELQKETEILSEDEKNTEEENSQDKEQDTEESDSSDVTALAEEAEPEDKEDTEEENSQDEEQADEEITDDNQRSAVASFSTFSMQPASLSTSLLKVGVSGGDVQQLQENLNAAGFHVTENPTTYFGPKTEAAVKDFQRANNLVVDGVAGPNTLTKLAEVLNESNNDDSSSSDNGLLQDGVDSPAAKAMKEDLYTLGYLDISSPNGKFGPQTEAAVIAFQKDHGLTADGVADDKTLAKIKEALNKDSADENTEETESLSSISSTLREGSRGEEVQLLQQKLNNAGFQVTDNPTTYFGPKTAAAVKDFQRANDLVVDGIAGPNTLAALEKALQPQKEEEKQEDTSSDFSRGDRGEEVRELQILLNDAGFHVTDNPTTYFGPKTEEAVLAFQKANNLSVTGTMDQNTIKLLKGINDTPPDTLKNGTRHDSVQKLQKKLNQAGFHVTDSTTNYFGPKTEGAVKELQRLYGLPVTGEADTATVEALDAVLNGYSNGTRSEKVRSYQKMLNDAGFFVTDNPTDYFGPKTESAVKEFQQAYDLPVTGVLDKQSIQKLETASQPLDRLEKGDRHSSVKELHQLLNDAGFQINKDASNYFGEETEAALIDFQQTYKLKADGIATEDVMDALNEAVTERNNALKRYDSSSEVKNLQQTLNALGYTVTSNPTNYFGPKTEAALKDFQRAEGLPVTGMLDSRTAEALEAEMNESIPSPFTSVLSQGDSGDSVIMLKQYLEAAGYNTNTSSTYDQVTADQVKAYQSANGLSASGSANGQTLSSLVEKRGTTYVFSGKQRFGHGVGMTQWGAYGMAQQGYSYDEILKHYYTGIDVVSSDSYKNKTMRVLLGDTQKNSADIESSSAYSIVTTNGDTLFDNVSGSTSVKYGSGGNGTYTVTNNGTKKMTTDPIYAASASNGTIEYDDVTYKGEIHFPKSLVDGKYTSSWVMDVVNHVNIDTYLEGVVPYEMYTSWNEPDAYKAQAIAARSYAMTKMKTTGNFDVYNDTRSQVYHGVPTGSHNSPTILNAIQSTGGQAIHYNGRLVEGVYSASASGHTVDAADVWGNNVGYLIGVPDPYDPSVYNQVSWTESFSLKELSAVDYFKNENKGEVLALQPTMKNERLQSIGVIMEKGTITLTGDQFRSAVDSNAMKSNILSIKEIN
ncbi:peptidoglycan-binding protein [Marinococcus halotolerans]|uniref:peptidoglycan-binding protein n=1 Tax=Marinococcus halotolerans TaxID=301092 RepID=UPI0003B74794|nr:peptidoglycan-binding protein [Marinococcus halotolerans]